MDRNMEETLFRIKGDRLYRARTAALRISSRLPSHKFMSKGKRSLRPLGARDDHPHLLRLLDDGEEFVDIDLACRSQKLKAETAPDECGGRQHPLFVLFEPL